MLGSEGAERLSAVASDPAQATESDKAGLLRNLFVAPELNEHLADELSEPSAVVAVGLLADFLLRQWFDLIEKVIATVEAVYLVRFGKLINLAHIEAFGVSFWLPVAAQRNCL